MYSYVIQKGHPFIIRTSFTGIIPISRKRSTLIGFPDVESNNPYNMVSGSVSFVIFTSLILIHVSAFENRPPRRIACLMRSAA